MNCNIYSELGLPDADQMLTKAQLVRELEFAILTRRMTRAVAAKRLGMSVRRLEAILSGHFRKETPEFLIGCLRLLGYDVLVEVTPSTPSGEGRGEFRLLPPVVIH